MSVSGPSDGPPAPRAAPAAPRWQVRATFLLVGLAVGLLAAAVALRSPASAPVTATGTAWVPEKLVVQAFKPEDEAFVVGYAYVGKPWAKELFRERALTNGRVDPVRGWTMDDLAGRYINVADGHRVTYQPRDPQITVWYFGGSTMYGNSQRDDHTIPSEIARLAEADGIRIRSVNFGVEGYNNYQETMAFADALSKGPPPDLAVFYDGANELATAVERVEVGDLDPDRTYYQAASDRQRSERGSGATKGTLTDAERDEALIDLASQQYRRGVAIARDLAEGAGVPVVHVWQPQLANTPRQAFEAPLMARLQAADPSTSDQLARFFVAVRDRSGVEPVDLLTALAGVDQPTFFDWAHTNEVGSKVIAEALYERLRPQLERAAG